MNDTADALQRQAGVHSGAESTDVASVLLYESHEFGDQDIEIPTGNLRYGQQWSTVVELKRALLRNLPSLT